MMEPEETATGAEAGADALAANRERRPVRVVWASEEEADAHAKVLQDIAKKGPCLWLPPEPAAS
jgi:uncharacterized protein YeaO (DUF488 family)